ncbi:MAG TPA: hypothetical protein VH598_00255 [Verrucomicrobiae bacterium]|nr:hypothetical protein [Verrucomicrobiae bacterium]
MFTTSAALCSASMLEHGTNRVSSPDWPDALGKLVNHPARSSGYSSFGISEFYYHADAKVLNELLTNYSRVPLPPLIVYLTPDVFSTDHQFELQIQNLGEIRAYAKILVNPSLKLTELKIPDSVRVEALPAGSVPLKPNGEVDDTEQNRLWTEIKAFVARRSRR